VETSVVNISLGCRLLHAPYPYLLVARSISTLELTTTHPSIHHQLLSKFLLLYFFAMNLDYQLPLSRPPSPDTILSEYPDSFYRICWKPNSAGIIVTSPALVQKHDLATSYPHIVQAWEAKQAAQKAEADRIEQNFVRFGRQFFNRDSDSKKIQQQRGVACDQSLQPGMRQHWGELRKCESHPPGRRSLHVCKGCRVSHYFQDSQICDRHIMARGARVPVCKQCAN
jgi:hypothetical protein